MDDAPKILPLHVEPLQQRWQTLDPFLFCVHHDDAYPAGNERMGPAASLAGRDIGQDFSGRDGWSMYHGDSIPGFPQHPHRGFETVTVARHGFIDHSDSLGACARFGEGDLQWMTAGRGIVHSEMFPLVNRDRPNRSELFQIWLNLPARRKMAEPHFALFWKEEIPFQVMQDAEGRSTTITSYAGTLPDGQQPPAPPPNSWAAQPENGVTIWTIAMAANARWRLPAADPRCNRRLYYFKGNGIALGGRSILPRHAVTLPADAEVDIANDGEDSELLLLQGRPINEPVAQYGPFVMNDENGLRQAFMDYRRTGFGGWPWPDHGPAHPHEQGRFARFPDGSTAEPTAKR